MKKALSVLGLLAGLAYSGIANAQSYTSSNANTSLTNIPTSLTPQLEKAKEAFYEKIVKTEVEKSAKDDSYFILIDKTDRKLYLYNNGQLDTVFSVGLSGWGGLEEKIKEGDGRTPEGKFKVGEKNPDSDYLRSLKINYSLRRDAERGVRERLISKRVYEGIISKHDSENMPSQKTNLGGNICIHGGGSWDWTDGCVALNDEDIEYLYALVDLGTPVVIRK